ncbi:hypothetical protein ACFL2J_04460 [Candidatus Omnitrophota bacterium]
MKHSKHYLVVILIIGLTVLASNGCSIPKRVAEHVSGNYMGRLEKDDIQGISQIVTLEMDECFQKVLALLKSNIIELEVLKIDRRNNSIMALVSQEATLDDIDSVFDENSADVGIFLVSAGPRTTKVEVRSLSSAIADYTAMKIFPALQTQN